MPLTVIIAPHNTEGKHTLRLDHAVQQIDLLILRVLLNDGLQRGKNLFNGLNKLRLVTVLRLNVLNDAGQISIHNKLPPQKYVPIWNVYMTGSHAPYIKMITPFPVFLKGFRREKHPLHCKKKLDFFVQCANTPSAAGFFRRKPVSALISY